MPNCFEYALCFISLVTTSKTPAHCFTLKHFCECVGLLSTYQGSTVLTRKIKQNVRIDLSAVV